MFMSSVSINVIFLQIIRSINPATLIFSILSTLIFLSRVAWLSCSASHIQIKFDDDWLFLFSLDTRLPPNCNRIVKKDYVRHQQYTIAKWLLLNIFTIVELRCMCSGPCQLGGVGGAKYQGARIQRAQPQLL